MFPSHAHGTLPGSLGEVIKTGYINSDLLSGWRILLNMSNQPLIIKFWYYFMVIQHNLWIWRWLILLQWEIGNLYDLTVIKWLRSNSGRKNCLKEIYFEYILWFFLWNWWVHFENWKLQWGRCQTSHGLCTTRSECRSKSRSKY